MAERETALTAAAGEHYAAYRLSGMGFPVALTRGGSPTVDLMVGDLRGNAALSIQVKTSNEAWRGRTRNPDESHWEWPVGKKAVALRGESIFYAFIDLRWAEGQMSVPDVFIVPSAAVSDSFPIPESLDWPMFVFWIYERDKSRYHERWDLLTNRLLPQGVAGQHTSPGAALPP